MVDRDPRVRRTRSLDPASTLSATGNPGGVSDLHEQPEPCPRFRTSAIGDGIVAVVAIPIQSATGDWARSTCSTLSRRDWLDEELALLHVLCDMAADHIAHASSLRRTRLATEELHDAQDRRIIIEHAKGMIAARQNISVDEAFAVIHQHALNHVASTQNVAEAIVTLELRPLAKSRIQQVCERIPGTVRAKTSTTALRAAKRSDVADGAKRTVDRNDLMRAFSELGQALGHDLPTSDVLGYLVGQVETAVSVGHADSGWRTPISSLLYRQR